MKSLSLLVLFYCVNLKLTLATYLSLDGDDWVAINQNESIALIGRVPGSVYSDLRRDNILKQDLYYGSNDINYRWVSYDNWTYEKSFQISQSLLSKEGVFLVAHGIDTVSRVFVNDVLVGKTDNMFVRYRFDVKSALTVGTNVVKIAFESATTYAKRQAQDYEKKYGYSVPPECNPGQYNGECHFNYIRKMAASFSWDWGPAFPTQGIWHRIGIEAYNSAIIRDVTVITNRVNGSDNWSLSLSVHVEANNITLQSDQLRGTLRVELDGHLLHSVAHTLEPGIDSMVKLANIPVMGVVVKAWYPNGVADNVQPLYNLSVSIDFEATGESTTKQVRIGFRTIELIQEPIKPEGLTFYFRVNGKPFYAKGSNWIPANALVENIDRDYLRWLLESAKEANMNMLRVWGGGIYELDYFYELADELGIMIWQDFMFACALYPVNEQFLESVDTEIHQQLRRLQHHVSIAIWAGNNENEGALVSPWWSEVRSHDQQYRNDYVKLYVDHIGKIVAQEDTSRPYVASSPSNGAQGLKDGGISKNPNDLRYGDVHWYDYSNPLWNWTIYPSAKFASEYGFQSYPSIDTLSQVIDEKDLTVPVSAAIDHHQHHPDGRRAIEQQIGYYMKMPSNGGRDRLDDLIYLSQVLQAMAMKTESEFYRRNRQLDAKGNGYTMGALYWQLNDIWQGPTWASIEFGGKWKLLHSFAKYFFANQLASPYEDSNQTLRVAFVRDDYLGVLPFNVSVQVFKWSSLKAVNEYRSQVTADSFSANIVFNHSIAALVNESKCDGREDCVLLIEIENADKKLAAHNFFLLSPLKTAKLVKPNVKVTKVGPPTKKDNRFVYDIELTAESVTPFVRLDFKSSVAGVVPHNGFFMFVSPKTVQFESTTNYTAQQILSNITAKTITDVM